MDPGHPGQRGARVPGRSIWPSVYARLLIAQATQQAIAGPRFGDGALVRVDPAKLTPSQK
jgi:hypothetical protein